MFKDYWHAWLKSGQENNEEKAEYQNPSGET